MRTFKQYKRRLSRRAQFLSLVAKTAWAFHDGRWLPFAHAPDWFVRLLSLTYISNRDSDNFTYKDYWEEAYRESQIRRIYKCR